MYSKRMKPVKKTEPKAPQSLEGDVLREATVPYGATAEPMLRTQIYLSRGERDFLQREASRCNVPIAAVIRGLIDERMALPQTAWEDNPMLRPTPVDPSWKGHPDGGINHDHYVYGSPKRWVKAKGRRVEAPPLPEDYYENPASRREYDARTGKPAEPE